MELGYYERQKIYAFLERETYYHKGSNGKYPFDRSDAQLFATYKGILNDKEDYINRILKYQRIKGTKYYDTGSGNKETDLSLMTYEELRNICRNLKLIGKKGLKMLEEESAPKKTIEQAREHVQVLTPEKVEISNAFYGEDRDIEDEPIQLYNLHDLAYAYGIEALEYDEQTLFDMGIKIEDSEAYSPELAEFKSLAADIIVRARVTDSKGEVYKRNDLRRLDVEDIKFILDYAERNGYDVKPFGEIEKDVLYKK